MDKIDKYSLYFKPSPLKIRFNNEGQFEVPFTITSVMYKLKEN